ncbi:predicted protein [Histoplasma capsulatum var. duboisii H88]|uniref:Predicted protein n=1 Tax=Ajellomyces capsulatus (strain H88) TaxID=544711 RepID=F0UI67_AJEC8|nr:predicted protein [Histoplasma capsulatum var. duboisii H88]
MGKELVGGINKRHYRSLFITQEGKWGFGIWNLELVRGKELSRYWFVRYNSVGNVGIEWMEKGMGLGEGYWIGRIMFNYMGTYISAGENGLDDWRHSSSTSSGLSLKILHRHLITGAWYVKWLGDWVQALCRQSSQIHTRILLNGKTPHLNYIFHTSSLTQILLPRMIWRPYEQAPREFEKSPTQRCSGMGLVDQFHFRGAAELKREDQVALEKPKSDAEWWLKESGMEQWRPGGRG